MLTERIIRDAKPGAKPTIIWDRTVTGLGCKVFPSGGKSFVLSYRVGGAKRLATLARCSEISLRDARERAGRELAAIRSGDTDPLRRREQAAQAPTMAEFVDQFFSIEAPARIKRGRMKAGTVEVYQYQAGKHILPAIGNRRVEDVMRADIEKMVAPLPGTTRNRVLALASRLFNLAELWELRAPGTNPTQKVERAREEARDRVLSGEEMAQLAGALADMEAGKPAAVAAIRFLAVTGLRVGEALAIQWSHVDMETGRLLIPESKTGRKWHDLPTPAVGILAAIPQIGAWVFTTAGRAPLTYKTVQAAFRDACQHAGIADARLHDLRRGVVSAAAASGANVAVLQRLLGHQTPQMALRYARELQDPVQATREAVAGQMVAMMRGKAGEVVPLRARND